MEYKYKYIIYTKNIKWRYWIVNLDKIKYLVGFIIKDKIDNDDLIMPIMYNDYKLENRKVFNNTINTLDILENKELFIDFMINNSLDAHIPCAI
jgi:hypothetical protein